MGREPTELTGLPSSLSPNQLKVVTMLAHGIRNKDIAEKLGMNHRTASTHRKDALKRLRLKNNAQLIRWAMQYGLIT